METYLTLEAVAHLLSATSTLVIAILLWRYPNIVPEVKRANLLLGASFLVLFYWQMVWFLISSNLILYLPHFLKTNTPLKFLYMPFSFLYLSLLINPRSIRWPDGLHFLPAIIILINLSPYYIVEGSIKLSITPIYHNYTYSNHQLGLFFSEAFSYNLLYLQIIIYWLIQLIIVVKIIDGKNKKDVFVDLTWLRWMVSYLAIQILIFLPYFLTALFGTKTNTNFFLTFLQSLCGILLSISLFLRPDLLFGIKKAETTSKKRLKNFHDLPFKKQEKQNKLSENRIKEIELLIHNYMNEKAPYLRHRYSIKEMANDLNTPPHQLSAFLNHVKGVKFNDFINQQRVKYSQEKIKEGECMKMTLDALAYECGFNNRNSFINSFKKHTGYTPSDYIKNF